MSKIDTRIQRNTEAFNTLVECLLQIHRAPDVFKSNKALIPALKNQSSTAAMSMSFEIKGSIKTTVPVSLNTLKTYAEKILPTGFDGLNRLRQAALEALELAERRAQRSNKRTKVGLSMRVEELESKLAMHQRTNFVLLQAIGRALDDIKSVRDAPNAGLRAHRASESIRALAAITSLNAPPFNSLPAPSENPVVKLEDYR
ncbi:hypothetical protein [Pseudomonas putida]|uniref:hypothetical protein n=1 Tax=Pseudomonas putida TaxID=303 RepID=UPI00069A1B4E|nr:hypothetical protein [Pseudomonas putida]